MVDKNRKVSIHRLLDYWVIYVTFAEDMFDLNRGCMIKVNDEMEDEEKRDKGNS